MICHAREPYHPGLAGGPRAHDTSFALRAPQASLKVTLHLWSDLSPMDLVEMNVHSQTKQKLGALSRTSAQRR
jgi:hypothetical protein